jgi:hypothetical protein
MKAQSIITLTNLKLARIKALLCTCDCAVLTGTSLSNEQALHTAAHNVTQLRSMGS